MHIINAQSGQIRHQTMKQIELITTLLYKVKEDLQSHISGI